jgi:hypothetical protein
MGGCLLLLGLGWSACGGAGPDRIPRLSHGSTERGAFVPPHAYEAYIRGELLLAEGRPAEAAQQLELANTAPDEDAYLLSRLAYAQLLSGSRAEAARTLAYAGRLDRCSEAVWLMRGVLAEQAGELDEARGALEKATLCAPQSPSGELALAALLRDHGQPAAAFDVLASAATRPYFARTPEGALRHGAAAERALSSSLATADAPTFAHAVADLSAYRASSSDTLEHTIRLALQRSLPRLALRLREQHAARLPPQLEAEVLIANGLLEELATLIARCDASTLGGHERTAEMALLAHAYERAELEATSALSERATDGMYALRARAVLALGRGRGALTDVAAIREVTLKRVVLAEALAAVGAPALARELAR